MQIDRFHGAARFLSNFAACKLFYEGWFYPTVEHAYQAAKTLDTVRRYRISECKTPGEAKKLGQMQPLRKDWEQIKLEVMEDLLNIKFQQPHFRRLLLETGDAQLIEGNTWGDTFWGQCPVGNGTNHLGQILMKIRHELREAERAFHSRNADKKGRSHEN